MTRRRISKSSDHPSRERKASKRLGKAILSKLFLFRDASSSYGQSPLTIPLKVDRRSYFNPWNWFLWFVDFLFRWIFTRSFSSLLPTLPAVIALIAVGALSIDSFRGSPQRKWKYLQKLVQSEKGESWDAALFHLKRLKDIEPEKVDWDFETFVVQARLGAKEEAAEKMAMLVNEHRHGKAAFWLATNRFELSKTASWTKEEHQLFQKYMAIAMESQDGSGDSCKLLMAKYLLATASPTETLSYIAPLQNKFPELALSASILYKSVGNVDECKRSALAASTYLQSQLNLKPTDIPLRTSLAQALILQSREEEAIESLQSGYLASNDAGLLRVQAETLVLWAQRLKGESNDQKTLGQRLNLISKAVTLAPNQQNVMDSLFEIAMECRGSKDEQVRKLLMSTLSNADPGVLHFVRGTIATIDGDMEKAVNYLNLAAKSGISLPAVLNNLAVAISGKKDGNQEEALRFVEMALQQLPNHHYLLETRGQILAKLNRPQDAIRDLEVAIQTEGLLQGALPTLIECYRKLGLLDMEEHYRKMLK